MVSKRIFNAKTSLMIGLLFVSSAVVAMQPGESKSWVEEFKGGMSSCIYGVAKTFHAVEKTLFDDEVWKTSIVAFGGFSVILNKPYEYDFVKTIGNRTLQTCLGAGLVGSVLKHALPNNIKKNSIITSLCHNPFAWGIFLERGVSVANYCWNGVPFQNYKILALGIVGTYIGINWANAYLKNNPKCVEKETEE